MSTLTDMRSLRKSILDFISPSTRIRGVLFDDSVEPQWDVHWKQISKISNSDTCTTWAYHNFHLKIEDGRVLITGLGASGWREYPEIEKIIEKINAFSLKKIKVKK